MPPLASPGGSPLDLHALRVTGPPLAAVACLHQARHAAQGFGDPDIVRDLAVVALEGGGSRSVPQRAGRQRLRCLTATRDLRRRCE
jgi:hypothetical protein